MGEEVDIDSESNEDCRESLRIVLEPELEYPPHTGDIAPDSRIHESCKERNMHDPESENSWI